MKLDFRLIILLIIFFIVNWNIFQSFINLLYLDKFFMFADFVAVFHLVSFYFHIFYSNTSF